MAGDVPERRTIGEFNVDSTGESKDERNALDDRFNHAIDAMSATINRPYVGRNQIADG